MINDYGHHLMMLQCENCIAEFRNVFLLLLLLNFLWKRISFFSIFINENSCDFIETENHLKFSQDRWRKTRSKFGKLKNQNYYFFFFVFNFEKRD